MDNRMTEVETLMWHIERDPWLDPSGGSLMVFDQPLDFARLRRAMAHAVAELPRFRQKVVSSTPLAPPHWEVDHEFDLDWHVRRIGAPGDGSLRALLDWLGLFLQDPYDRDRPLWQWVAIDNLPGGKGALAIRLHHVVVDGQGAVRLGATYTSPERDAPEPPEVDLPGLIASEIQHAGGGVGQIRTVASDLLRRPAEATRAVVNALTHPPQLAAGRREAGDLARSMAEQMRSTGSPLWQHRSRARRMEALSVPFKAAHDAAKAWNGTVNDFFVTGATEAGVRYHRELGVSVESFRASFVVSTRHDEETHGNKITPLMLDVPAGELSLRARFDAVRDMLHALRDTVHGDGAMKMVAPVANLLPVSWLTGILRDQAGHLDFATSNVAGNPGDTYVAGAKALHTYVFGPTAATAFNLTVYSAAGNLDIGLHVDPAAVNDSELLRSCLESSYADLIKAARRKR